MPRVKPLPSQKIIKILEKTGFRTVRQKGSHIIMINDKGTRIVIPVHPGKDVKPGLIRAIMKEALLFAKYLRYERETWVPRIAVL